MQNSSHGGREQGSLSLLFSRRELDDHLTVHVLETTKFKTVSVKVALRRNLTAEEVAANACIPFVLRRGSQRFPTSRHVARFLEDLYGARFGVDSVKMGETQILEFSLEVAGAQFLNAPTSPLREGLQFLGDILLHPQLVDDAFRPEVVSQEADGLRRRIEGLINEKPQYALERLRQEMCRNEPFGLHRYGSVSALARLDPRDLYTHYRRILAESPIDVFVVGDVLTPEVEQWVREALPFPRAQVQRLQPVVTPQPQAIREKIEEEDVNQGVLALGYRTGRRYPDDGYERMMVYNGILGAFPHSKLFLNVREKASLAYFAATRLDGTKGIMMAIAGIDSRKYRQAREIIERQVDDMAAGQISDQEIQATRKALIHSLRTVGDGAQSLINQRLLGLVNGRSRAPEEIMKGVEAVERADVVQVAREVQLDTVYFLTSRQRGE